MNKERFIYYLIRGLTYPFRLMPYSWIRACGRWMGTIAYYCMREYRKRALSNIALASDLVLTKEEMIQLAKQSFQNLAINCLEYPKLDSETDFSKVFLCENPEKTVALNKQGYGIIYFCGHLSNWEVLFLDGTTRMTGIAIGKSIKNKRLYNWILSIREKNGGKIVAPRNAIKEGLRALRKGQFIGIVGDQGMPDSGYSFPFLGRRAWTSTAPALLSYKTNSPIIFAETHRTRTGYQIRYADPLWPDLSKPMEEEVVRMMNTLLTQLQNSIKRYPGEWLWQHNRWKQQSPQNIYKRFRHDCICVILPDDPTLLPHLATFREIYPLDFLFLIVPQALKSHPLIPVDGIFYYTELKQTLLDDLRFKLVFNFTSYRPIHSHYERLSAFEVLDFPTLQALAAPKLPPHLQNNLTDILKRALCRPGTIWNPEHAS